MSGLYRILDYNPVSPTVSYTGESPSGVFTMLLLFVWFLMALSSHSVCIIPDSSVVEDQGSLRCSVKFVSV